MKSIKDILSFDFDFETYITRASSVINKFVVQEVKKRATELDLISSRIKSSELIIKTEYDIDLLIRRLSLNNGNDVTFSRSELRVLSYYLYKIESPSCINLLFQLFDQKWNNSYLHGLIDYVFRFWDTNDKNFIVTKDFLCKKIYMYVGGNRKFKGLKDNTKYLENNGPATMGAYLKSINKQLIDCVDILGMSLDKITYKYFSDAIISYYSYKFNEDVNYQELTDILEKHNNQNTDKIVLSYIVVTKKKFTIIEKDILANLTKKRIGDCENNSKWFLPNSFSSDKIKKLQESQKIIRIWTAEKYINVYFDLCVDDPRRRNFWHKYINYISSIRIIGSNMIHSELMSDERLSSILDSRFISLDSKSCKTSALVMQIGNLIFIEFSDVGALYVYKKEDLIINNIFERKYLNAINDIKRPSLNSLIETYNYNYYFYEYGRLVHIGDWEQRLRKWFEYNKIYT